MSSTPFQTGGGGTNFEQSVQSAFLLSFVIRLPLPMLLEGEITGLLFQAESRGYQTDDLLVEANDRLGSRRMLLQIKHQLAFTEKDAVFAEVIKAFWTDFNNSELFDQSKDKLVIVTGGLPIAVRSHLITLLNYAATSATSADFFTRAQATKTKKDQLDLLRAVLKKANNDIEIADDILWSFLRCMAVLDFDFSSSNSKDHAYCLQLIKLSKQPGVSQTEMSVWDSLVANSTTFNSTGGYINADNLKQVVDLNFFDLNHINAFYGYLSKLMKDSSLVMAPIKDNIQGLRFPMTTEKEMLINSTAQHQLTIVTGIPGAGKSAVVKSAIYEGIANGYVIFKADQLQSSTLSGALAAQGIHCTVEDLLGCLSLFSNPIIFIESAEKLLEGDFGNAFSQLVTFLEKNDDIRIVLTARSYAVDLIVQRYMLPQSKLHTMTVAPLSDNDLEEAEKHFPVLTPLLQHSKIRELLRSPKYLALSLATVQRESVDLTGITMSSFKAKLWSAIIEDGTLRSSGKSIKRQRAFYSIALQRARTMSLFVQPDQSLDDAAIEALENDEVLYRNGDEFAFAPAHDIFEDWALVRYVAEVYKKFPLPTDFFRELGHEPAVRRALRLWVEDILMENGTDVITLLRNTIKETNVERYWADELLVAVFRSTEASAFFSNFEQELLTENCALLARCIHLLRTCCRETSSKTSSEPIQLPIGSGWRYCIQFINEHVGAIEPIKATVLYFLSDWEFRFLFGEGFLDQEELSAAKSIVLHFIKQVEQGEEFWKEHNHERFVSQLVDCLFRIAGFAKEETEALIINAMKKSDEDGWRVRRSGELYNIVIKKTVSGINTINICYLYPDLVMSICKKVWRYRRPKLPKNADDMTRLMHESRNHSLEMDQRWAIKDRQSFFPPGVHKIPVYNLLRTDAEKTLQFIIEFVNQSVAYYAAGEYDHKHKLEKVTILGLEKGARKIWGAPELWVIFRGASVTSYLLESILKSLEKYLLELCERNRQGDKEKVRKYFDIICKQTNSVAPLSVLASVTMAYPDVVGHAMIPILSIPQVYNWDFHRVMHESSSMAMYDSEIPWWAQQEKYASNALPHRKKYGAGLSDFIVNHQFNVRSINEDLFRLFDRMKRLKAVKSSIVFKKKLTEIDARNWKAQEYSEELGGFPITPEYNNEIKEMMEGGKELIEHQNNAAHFSQLVKELYASTDKNRFADWKTAWKYYEENDNQDRTFDRFALFCITGLRDFNDQLSEEERNTCIGLLLMSLNTIIREVYHLHNDEEENIYDPIWEAKEILESIHILIDVFEGTEYLSELGAACIYLLKVPFEEYRVKEFPPYFRTKVMEQHSLFGKRIWYCMVELAAWQKQHAVSHSAQNHEAYYQFQVKEQAFIYSYLRSEEAQSSQTEISFETHDAATAVLAMQIIPFGSKDPELTGYVPGVVKEILADTNKEVDTDFDWSGRKKKGRRIPHQLMLALERWMSGYLLFASKENVAVLFDLMLDTISKVDRIADRYGGPGLFDFVKSVLDGILDQLNIHTSAIDTSSNNQLNTQFWLVWDALYAKIQQTFQVRGEMFFTSTMLFDPKYKWDEERRNFPSLTDYAHKYEVIAQALGKYSPDSLLRTLSTIGAETLLPDGLHWLRNAIREDPLKMQELGTKAAERFAELLYRNHILSIKSQQKRLNDFLWLLDAMISQGSSKAYLIRENVITYKSASA